MRSQVKIEAKIPLWAVFFLLVLAVIANFLYWAGLLDALSSGFVTFALLGIALS